MTDGDQILRERAANGYVVWPLAVSNLFSRPEGATAWSRIHARQAFVFGIAATLGYLVLLALPLIVTLLIPNPSSTAVVWLYVVGILADFIGAFVVMGLALSYRERALRGELFAIPYLGPIADRLFPIDRA